MKKIKPKINVYFLAFFSFLLYSCTTPVEDIELDESVSENKITSSNANSSSGGHHYVGNLKNVLGDVKQAVITDKLKTTDQVDNLLDGFKEMGVNGIRVPIFAEGVIPNKPMFDYLYEQMVARGFKVFANPAQGGGGHRIANGILNGDLTSVKDDFAASDRLISRIIDFAQEYKVDWINPFNEDGRPGSVWSIAQINDIYASVSGNTNGATLIGSCDWGLVAGRLSLLQTTMKNHIAVAATHNLGFQHNLWPAYIEVARGDLNLPVWDSETHDRLEGNAVTRLDAAINAGVDGLVLYNSWNTINLSSGALNEEGQRIKDKTTQYYMIRNVQSGDNIKPFNNGTEGTLMVQAPPYWNGVFSQWEIVPTSNGYVRFKNRGSNMYFRPTNNNRFSNVYATNSFSGLALHVQWRIDDINNTSSSFIVNRSSGKKLYSLNGDDLGNNGNETNIRITQVPVRWTRNATRWEFIKAN